MLPGQKLKTRKGKNYIFDNFFKKTVFKKDKIIKREIGRKLWQHVKTKNLIFIIS